MAVLYTANLLSKNNDCYQSNSTVRDCDKYKFVNVYLDMYMLLVILVTLPQRPSATGVVVNAGTVV